MKRILIPIVVVVAVLCAGAAIYLKSADAPAPASPASSSSGKIRAVTAPELLNIVRDLKSPVVLINFWASWCGPCKGEFPNILKLRQEMANRGLKVVFVSIDEPHDLQAAEDFITEQKIDFQTYYKGNEPVDFVTKIFPPWQGAVPTTVLMNSELKVLDAWEGDATLKEFEDRLKPHLTGEKAGS